MASDHEDASDELSIGWGTSKTLSGGGANDTPRSTFFEGHIPDGPPKTYELGLAEGKRQYENALFDLRGRLHVSEHWAHAREAAAYATGNADGKRQGAAEAADELAQWKSLAESLQKQNADMSGVGLESRERLARMAGKVEGVAEERARIADWLSDVGDPGGAESIRAGEHMPKGVERP